MTSAQPQSNPNHKQNKTKWFEKSYVIAIGINNYKPPIESLRTAVNDAEAIARLLEEKHGFEKPKLLRDEYATKDEIIKVITDLEEEVSKKDRLIFYYAGHGIALPSDNDPQGYLIPYDAVYPDDKTYLSMSNLVLELSKIVCKHALIILDCCHAGAIRWASPTRQTGSRAQTIHPTTLDLYINSPAWQILASSDEDQKAHDTMTLNMTLKNNRDADIDLSQSHSPFAYHLIKGLENGEADLFPQGGDGIITADELHLFLRSVDIETGKSGTRKRQTPQLLPFPKRHGKGEFVFLLKDYEKIKEDLKKRSPDPVIDDKEKNNPYRGLESYESEHADWFFGRTLAIEALLTWQLLSMHQQMLKTPYLLDKSAFRLHSLLLLG